MPHPGYDRPADDRDSEAIKARVSELIRFAKQTGATQESLGKALGTGQNTVSAWELGKAVIGAIYLARLIRACSRPGAAWDANWVLTGKGEKFVVPARESPQETEVRVGLTILAKMEDATSEIRRGLLHAESRIRPS